MDSGGNFLNTFAFKLEGEGINRRKVHYDSCGTETALSYEDLREICIENCGDRYPTATPYTRRKSACKWGARCGASHAMLLACGRWSSWSPNFLKYIEEEVSASRSQPSDGTVDIVRYLWAFHPPCETTEASDALVHDSRRGELSSNDHAGILKRNIESFKEKYFVNQLQEKTGYTEILMRHSAYVKQHKCDLEYDIINLKQRVTITQVLHAPMDHFDIFENI